MNKEKEKAKGTGKKQQGFWKKKTKDEKKTKKNEAAGHRSSPITRQVGGSICIYQ